MATASTRLVDFLMALDEDTIAPKLLEHASMAVLDNLACGLYGSRQDWGRIVREFALAEGSQGRSTLFGSSQPVSAARRLPMARRRTASSWTISCRAR